MASLPRVRFYFSSIIGCAGVSGSPKAIDTKRGGKLVPRRRSEARISGRQMRSWILRLDRPVPFGSALRTYRVLRAVWHVLHTKQKRGGLDTLSVGDLLLFLFAAHRALVAASKLFKHSADNHKRCVSKWRDAFSQDKGHPLRIGGKRTLLPSNARRIRNSLRRRDQRLPPPALKPSPNTHDCSESRLRIRDSFLGTYANGAFGLRSPDVRHLLVCLLHRCIRYLPRRPGLHYKYRGKSAKLGNSRRHPRAPLILRLDLSSLKRRRRKQNLSVISGW
eukprot:Gregarina_sp_Poly_1__5919@NODE_3118_length_1364_cov_6_289129_g1979_i0_p1_GENE_NODE_3118_length_1364_cov_6_289129_g1979_i0NODE_3118_length_1364_cov_6_289129_g1979_i0_p1_ORF_typecomplete_len277_score15_67_NODE_3118_length_1364_cov_6_289129_g1979_i03511181